MSNNFFIRLDELSKTPQNQQKYSERKRTSAKYFCLFPNSNKSFVFANCLQFNTLNFRPRLWSRIIKGKDKEKGEKKRKKRKEQRKRKRKKKEKEAPGQ
jgi:hypothetical protein